MNRIIQFSLHNRPTICLLAILLLLTGCYTAWHMEVDVFPDLNAPTVVVMTEAEGMAPEEVERLVTFPVETAVNGAADVRRVRSSSTTGFSVVWVEFEWGTDIYRARQIVTEKLAAIGESLPPHVGNPTLGPQSSILGEVLFIGLTVKEGTPAADSLSLLDLRTLADWTLRPRLLSTGGVAQVTVIGGDIKEYQIQLHPERMQHYGVSLSDVLEVTNAMNQDASGGVLYQYGNEYIIRGVVTTNDPDLLGQTVVRYDGGRSLLLNEIADVQIGAKTPKMGLASINGRPSVVMTVTKQPSVGTLQLTEDLDKAIEEIKEQLPACVEVRTDLYRQQSFIDSSINNIQHSLVEGAIFVVLVLFIFLMNWRTTLISLVTIPLALLVSILTLRFMDLTINTMSIGGMAIAIGSLVDDAIVDVENVWKRLKKRKTEGGKSILSEVFEASKEVRMPILNSTLIIVVSFIPLFFLSGMEGRMLAPLGIAFIVSLFASTLVALTLTPVLCSYLLPGAKALQEGEKEPWVTTKLRAAYAKALDWAFMHHRAVIGSTLALFLLTLVSVFTLGHSFLPAFNEGSLTINLGTIPGVSLEESDNLGRRAEQILMQIPEIKVVARKTGRAELDEHAQGVNGSEIEAPFELKDRSKDEFIADIRQRLSVLPGCNIEIGQPISHRLDAMLSGTQANIAIKLFGSDLNHMFMIGNQIKQEISEIKGVADLNVEQQVERPQLKIIPKRELLARYGITLPQFQEYINALLGGQVVSQVYEGNRSFDLTVKVHDEDREGIEQIRDLRISTPSGRLIPLSMVADVVSSSGPNTINRENVIRKIVISCNVAGRDLRSVVNEIQERVSANIVLPEDYRIEYGGQFESEQAATRILLLTSCLSVLVILFLLFHQFKSWRQSIVILLNLPLALIGGVMALLFTSGILSIPAIIGFISLFGIATRNGMLLVDRYNTLLSEAPASQESFADRLKQAVRMGSLDRLNPIIMTALTSALALIPLALGGEQPGNEIQSPMAQVILGGLLTSTLLNAFVVPIMYLITEKRAAK